jgi:sialate O-acetylesterase
LNFRSRLSSSLVAVALAACSLTAAAEVRLPNMLSSHAVLQRERPIHIWGWATPGAHLVVSFHDQTVAANADALGAWSLYLQPEHAGGPYTLRVSGDGPEKALNDMLIGDVWFASGQSNMEMPMNGFPPTAVLKDADKEIAAANHPKLRLLLVQHKSSDYPLQDAVGTWTTCTPDTARYFSAVAYFFGRDLAATENVPIGLVDATWGGTPADSWVSMDTLGTDPGLLPAFASRATFADRLAEAPAQLAANKAEDEQAKAAGKPLPSHPWQPDESSWSPAGLYNGMIAPFAPMTIKGFLWYQGETNSAHDRAPYYGTLFAALIHDWRSHFAQGNLPFLYAQISSFSSPGEDWGMVREQQRRTLAVAQTAMAVTLDVGLADNVHPPDKQTVGARLALAARGLVYGENVAYQPPLFREATTETQANGTVAMRVWFDHAERLTAKTAAVSGFELAGDDHHFVPAEARIDGSTVMVSAAAVAHPVYVRYAWAGYSPDGLYNAAGLPASTFTSDNSPFR